MGTRRAKSGGRESKRRRRAKDKNLVPHQVTRTSLQPEPTLLPLLLPVCGSRMLEPHNVVYTSNTAIVHWWIS